MTVANYVLIASAVVTVSRILPSMQHRLRSAGTGAARIPATCRQQLIQALRRECLRVQLRLPAESRAASA